MTYTHTFTRTHARGITLTGVDDSTSLDDMMRLLAAGAELGFLFTESREGRKRYPCYEWIVETAFELRARLHDVSKDGEQARLALHVCGTAARATLLAKTGLAEKLAEPFPRIQVNGKFGSSEELARLCRRFTYKTVITQETEENHHIAALDLHNHALLVDASGGRGISPARWSRPLVEKPVGYAGGLGPDNLAEELSKIADVACDGGTDWWVDMEGKLRDEKDRFDVAKALRCVEIFNEFEP